MCGIVGVAGAGVGLAPYSPLGAMLGTLSLRGPDAHGSTAFPNCVLGHTRLAILDLATGSQPMHDNARRMAITFNGEIYNFQELRARLQQLGHRFSTRSDTEVILKAYLQYGPACAEHLDGMFAFAVWDDEANTLFLARDRFGKKPLYYGFTREGHFVFASEIKTLLASGELRAELDYESVDAYLRLLYVPPDRTVYRGLAVVPPAHTAVLAQGRLQTRRYWTLTPQPLRIGYDEAKEEVRRLLHDAVRKRMVADVEVGSLLSGGVDSTIVTQIAQQYASRPLKTFSVGYGDFIDELPYSRSASERIGTDHHVLQVGGAALADELQRVMAYFDEPHADSSNVAQCLVSRLAQTRVKVALCGDGGDEVFMGYPWYWRDWEMGRRWRLTQALFSSPFRDYLSGLQVFRPEQRRQLWNGQLPSAIDVVPADLRPPRSGGVRSINRFDLSVYLPGQLLVKSDRAGMMNSLEVRSPLLDHRLAEFVFNLPTRYKTDRARGKVILKDILRETMPASFVDRPKQGFGAPVADWLRTICQPLVRDLLGGPDAHLYGMMSRQYVTSMVDRFYGGSDSSDYLRLWVLLCFEIWLRSHRPARAAARVA